MADQIVLYLSLCSQESSFTASAISSHLTTNLWAIGLFHDISYTLEGKTGEKGTIKLKGRDIKNYGASDLY
jgi:RNA 3'-terminal phosphate cyclase